jgi:hypothetical protein
MRRVRIALGLAVPFLLGAVFVVVTDLGIVGPGLPKDINNPGPQGSINPAILVVSTVCCLLAGLVGGFLLRSFWAVASVPLTLVAGEIVTTFLYPGAAVVQPDPLYVVLMVFVVAVLLLVALPTVPGAIIGVLLSKRTAQPRRSVY